jgi:hypothetical protein
MRRLAAILVMLLVPVSVRAQTTPTPSPQPSASQSAIPIGGGQPEVPPLPPMTVGASPGCNCVCQMIVPTPLGGAVHELPSRRVARTTPRPQCPTPDPADGS